LSGKGSDRRPTQVSDGEFESNWRRTFGRTTRRRGALERAARRIGQREMVFGQNASPASPQEAQPPE